MKKLLIALIGFVPMMISCGGGGDSSKNSKDSTQVDSLIAYFHKLDSLQNSGQLFHIDVYDLGKLKSVEFQVFNIKCQDESLQYINLRKDCGSAYYYDWEDARLLQSEVKYFTAAIDTITANYERKVKNEERYIYVTKDDIRLYSSSSGDKWYVSLSVDYRKKDATIVLSKEDLATLKKMLLEGEKKIKEIK